MPGGHHQRRSDQQPAAVRRSLLSRCSMRFSAAPSGPAASAGKSPLNAVDQARAPTGKPGRALIERARSGSASRRSSPATWLCALMALSLVSGAGKPSHCGARDVDFSGGHDSRAAASASPRRRPARHRARPSPQRALRDVPISPELEPDPARSRYRFLPPNALIVPMSRRKPSPHKLARCAAQGGLSLSRARTGCTICGIPTPQGLFWPGSISVFYNTPSATQAISSPCRPIPISARLRPNQSFPVFMRRFIDARRKRRTSGNRVWADTPPWVQIPNSPPIAFPVCTGKAIF